MDRRSGRPRRDVAQRAARALDQLELAGVVVAAVLGREDRLVLGVAAQIARRRLGLDVLVGDGAGSGDHGGIMHAAARRTTREIARGSGSQRRGQLGAVVHVQALEDLLEPRLHGVDGNLEGLRDLGVRPTHRGQLGDLELPGREHRSIDPAARPPDRKLHRDDHELAFAFARQRRLAAAHERRHEPRGPTTCKARPVGRSGSPSQGSTMSQLRIPSAATAERTTTSASRRSRASASCSLRLETIPPSNTIYWHQLRIRAHVSSTRSGIRRAFCPHGALVIVTPSRCEMPGGMPSSGASLRSTFASSVRLSTPMRSKTCLRRSLTVLIEIRAHPRSRDSCGHLRRAQRSRADALQAGERRGASRSRARCTRPIARSRGRASWRSHDALGERAPHR